MAITNLTGTTWKLKSPQDITLLPTMQTFALTLQVKGYQEVSANFMIFNSTSSGYPVQIKNGNTEAWIMKVPENIWIYSTSTNTTIDNPVITITGGAGVTDTTLISWLSSNATQVVPATTITYNNETIDTLEAGQTATLKCAGEKAVTDIVIVPEFPVDIAYGAIINVAHKGQTATLKCEGKKMKHDVVISTSLTVGGTWEFVNETIDFSMLEGELIQEINGTMINSFGYPFDKIKINPSNARAEVYVTKSNYLTYRPVYDATNGFYYNATGINFGDEPQAVTVDFYNWLTANATMQ